MRLAIRIVLTFLTVGVLWMRIHEFRAAAGFDPERDLAGCSAQAQP